MEIYKLFIDVEYFKAWKYNAKSIKIAINQIIYYLPTNKAYMTSILFYSIF